MIYMFLSNNPSSGDINSSNLPCLFFFVGGVGCSMGPSVDKGKCAPNLSNPLNIVLIFGRFIYQVKVMCHMKE